MTVVVGFVGTDGAVMASDSQASEYDKTKYDIEKLWVCAITRLLPNAAKGQVVGKRPGVQLAARL
jgi:hypothetical protein